jgi:hypothetical protein
MFEVLHLQSVACTVPISAEAARFVTHPAHHAGGSRGVAEITRAAHHGGQRVAVWPHVIALPFRYAGCRNAF